MTRPDEPERVHPIGELHVGAVVLGVEVLEFADDRPAAVSLTRCAPDLASATNLDAAQTRRLRALLAAALERLPEGS